MDNNNNNKIYLISEIYNKLNYIPQEVEENLPEDIKNEIIITGNIKSIKDYYDNKYIILSDNTNKIKCFCHKSLKHIINKLEEEKNMTFKGKLKFKYSLYNNTYELQYYITSLIEIKEEKSPIEELIIECNKLNLFENKKIINWNKIKNIILLSKKDTHGYNDFITQINKIKDFINVKLYDIILEGPNTEKSLIDNIININKFNDNINDNNKNNKIDCIIICRGGGSTENISLSYDKLNIFKCIKQSKIPICSAIGHSDDKDNRLLITNITDYNFITPTEAGSFIFNSFIKSIQFKINKYNNLLFNYKNNILDILINELNIYKNKINNINNYLKNDYKYININNNDINNIILLIDNKKYKLDLSKLKEINLIDKNYKINIFINNELKNNIIKINKSFLNKIKFNKELFNYCNNLYDYYYKNKEIYELFNIYNELNNNNDNLNNDINLLIKYNLINNEIININNKLIKYNNLLNKLL